MFILQVAFFFNYYCSLILFSYHRREILKKHWSLFELIEMLWNLKIVFHSLRTLWSWSKILRNSRDKANLLIKFLPHCVISPASTSLPPNSQSLRRDVQTHSQAPAVLFPIKLVGRIKFLDPYFKRTASETEPSLSQLFTFSCCWVFCKLQTFSCFAGV